MYAISPATKEIIGIYKNTPPHKPYEASVIPEDKFKFSSDIGIYADKVSFISPEDNFGIIIESKDIADMLKNSFDLAWEEAKRLDKKVKSRFNKKINRPLS